MDVTVVETRSQLDQCIDEMYRWCEGTGLPVGLDTETTGSDPGEESPVGRARVWCTTTAWGPTSDELRAVFFPWWATQYLRRFLEDTECGKVGANLYGYEKAVYWNEGVDFRGVVGDTVDMWRLLDVNRLSHGLKPLGTKLGYHMVSFAEVAGRPKRLKATVRRKPGTRKENGVVAYVASGEHHGFSHAKGKAGREIIHLDELWADYPQRRDTLVWYALQDAVVGYHGWRYLKRKLEKRCWQ